jgi:hypothetical protein
VSYGIEIDLFCSDLGRSKIRASGHGHFPNCWIGGDYWNDLWRREKECGSMLLNSLYRDVRINFTWFTSYFFLFGKNWSVRSYKERDSKEHGKWFHVETVITKRGWTWISLLRREYVLHRKNQAVSIDFLTKSHNLHQVIHTKCEKLDSFYPLTSSCINNHKIPKTSWQYTKNEYFVYVFKIWNTE